MMNNVEFLEEYKRLDALCKDMFSSSEGVSTYIRTMEMTPYAYNRQVFDWENTYRRLKHFRWLRNHLVHDVGAMDEEECSEADIEWIRDFYQQIINVSDLLAIVNKLKQTAQKEFYRSEKSTSQPQPQKMRKPFFSAIVEKIKNFFHNI